MLVCVFILPLYSRVCSHGNAHCSTNVRVCVNIFLLSIYDDTDDGYSYSIVVIYNSRYISGGVPLINICTSICRHTHMRIVHHCRVSDDFNLLQWIICGIIIYYMFMIRHSLKISKLKTRNVSLRPMLL